MKEQTSGRALIMASPSLRRAALAQILHNSRRLAGRSLSGTLSNRPAAGPFLTWSVLVARARARTASILAVGCLRGLECIEASVLLHAHRFGPRGFFGL